MRRQAMAGVVGFAVAVGSAILAGCSAPTAPPPSPADSPPAAMATATATATDTATAAPEPSPSVSHGPSSSLTAPPTSWTTRAVPTPTPTKTPTETAAVTAGPTATPTTSWTTFTTSDGTLTFDLPATWTVLDPAGDLAEGGGTFAEVRNEARKLLATLRTNMATGSSCMEKYPYAVLEAQNLPALEQDGTVPRFIFETRGNDDQPGPQDTPAAAYGITSGPLPEGETTCAMFQFFTWPPNAASFGAFYNPENNRTPGDQSLPYLELAKKYVQTAEYQDLKRMITSLRPAD